MKDIDKRSGQPGSLLQERPVAWFRALRRWKGVPLAGCLLLCICLGGRAQENSTAGVTYERILNAAGDAENWLTYSGRYSGWCYRTLDRINTGNVTRLRLEWAFQTADLGQFETTPVVVDGVLYGTGQNNRACA